MADREPPPLPDSWVRHANGKYILCWIADGERYERPLTFLERLLWNLAARTPKP